MLPKEKRIRSKKELREYLSAELPYFKAGFFTYLLQCNEDAVLRRHQILLRRTEYYLNSGKKIRGYFYKMLLLRFQNKYCLHIPINCCGKGLRIMHVGPILMNGSVTIGENCKIHFNTAFVAGGTSQDSPTLGNSVVVGVGATILGGVTIADNVAIGAGAVVNKDVLEKSVTVAGVPAKKISNNGSANWGKGAKPKKDFTEN